MILLTKYAPVLGESEDKTHNLAYPQCKSLCTPWDNKFVKHKPKLQNHWVGYMDFDHRKKFKLNRNRIVSEPRTFSVFT